MRVSDYWFISASRMNSTLNLAIQKVSRKLSVDQKLVEAVYRSYWLFIKTQISSDSLKEISEEEFDSLTTNFNLPYLGKLYVEYYKIEKYKRQRKYLEEYVKAKENKADRQSGTGD